LPGRLGVRKPYINSASVVLFLASMQPDVETGWFCGIVVFRQGDAVRICL
jgi:hypothetical protein